MGTRQSKSTIVQESISHHGGEAVDPNLPATILNFSEDLGGIVVSGMKYNPELFLFPTTFRQELFPMVQQACGDVCFMNSHTETPEIILPIFPDPEVFGTNEQRNLMFYSMRDQRWYLRQAKPMRDGKWDCFDCYHSARCPPTVPPADITNWYDTMRLPVKNLSIT